MASTIHCRALGLFIINIKKTVHAVIRKCTERASGPGWEERTASEERLQRRWCKLNLPGYIIVSLTKAKCREKRRGVPEREGGQKQHHVSREAV